MTEIIDRQTLRYGALAGLAGGLAEIAWVTSYAGMTGGNAAVLAQTVTTAMGLGALLPALPTALGIAVHMALAVTLGIALAFAWRSFAAHRAKAGNPFPFVVTALAGIWVVNFFVVLPLVSPAFVHLLPYSVSLVSKLLFGLAAAEVIRRMDTATHPMNDVVFAPSPS